MPEIKDENGGCVKETTTHTRSRKYPKANNAARKSRKSHITICDCVFIHPDESNEFRTVNCISILNRTNNNTPIIFFFT